MDVSARWSPLMAQITAHSPQPRSAKLLFLFLINNEIQSQLIPNNIAVRWTQVKANLTVVRISTVSRLFVL